MRLQRKFKVGLDEGEHLVSVRPQHAGQQRDPGDAQQHLGRWQTHVGVKPGEHDPCPVPEAAWSTDDQVRTCAGWWLGFVGL